MPDLNTILAYVADVPKSVALYSKLLGAAPVESSPNFAMFVLPNGVRLGLWATRDVQPRPSVPGGVEFGFVVESNAAVTALTKDWQSAGLTLLQPPTQMDFGFTATLADLDGHRLRVFSPSPQ